MDAITQAPGNVNTFIDIAFIAKSHYLVFHIPLLHCTVHGSVLLFLVSMHQNIKHTERKYLYVCAMKDRKVNVPLFLAVPYGNVKPGSDTGLNGC